MSSRLAQNSRSMSDSYSPQADISVLILGEADKPQNRRQFRINYELILSEILFLTADRRGSHVRNGDYTDKWRRAKYGRARRANRGRRFRPDTPGHYVFRSQSLVRYPPTDSLVPKRNDRQKIELNVEVLEGHLGCMKSTHSMNAATWGR